MGKVARQIELLLRLQIGSFASESNQESLSKPEDSTLNSPFSTDQELITRESFIVQTLLDHLKIRPLIRVPVYSTESCREKQKLIGFIVIISQRGVCKS